MRSKRLRVLLPIRRRRLRRYSVAKGVIFKRGFSLLYICLLIISMAAQFVQTTDRQVANAATATVNGLYPTADVGGASNNFATAVGTPTNYVADPPSGSCVNDAHHCNYLDSNDTGSGTGYSTGLLMDGTTAVEEYELQNFTVSGTFQAITTVKVWYDAVSAGCNGGTCDRFDIQIWNGSGYETTKNGATLTTSSAEYSETWTGLSITNQNDTRVRFTRILVGTGSNASKDDNITLSEVRVDITYTYAAPPASFIQEDYIFENDDANGGTATAQAGSLFSGSSTSPTFLDGIPKGEKTNLRVHLKNTSSGQITNDNMTSLFYDRNDGIWTKVESNASAGTSPGSSADCQGFDGSGGSSSFYCSAVLDAASSTGGYASEIVVNPATGQPMMMFSYGTSGEVNLAHAQYVGSGGNCDSFTAGGSDAWQCQMILDGSAANDVEALDFAISPKGEMWAVFNNRLATGPHDDLIVAKFAGAAAQDCDSVAFDSGGSDYWDCAVLFDAAEVGDIDHVAIAIGNDGIPWVAFNNEESSTDDVVVAKYQSAGGGNCDTNLDGGTTGSDFWVCTTVFDGGENSDGTGLDIVMDGSNNPHVSFKNEESGSDLMVASYVGGSSGNCSTNLDGGTSGSPAWNCVTVFDGGESSDISDTAININGAEQLSVAFTSDESSGDEIWYANRVGAGQNCDTALDGSTAGSDLWNCERVFDGSDASDAQHVAMAIDPSGKPWIVFNDDETTDRVIVARRVGSAGDCDDTGSFDGGNDAWECDSLFEDSVTNTTPFPSIAMNSRGNPMISFTDQVSGHPNIIVADMRRSGEILAVPSRELLHKASLTTSHADMGTFDDSSNQSSADCVSATTWNNGSYLAYGETAVTLLPAGNVTSQCTEVMWTLDTSQATPGTTYRFVVAVNDNWRRDKGPWHGPGTIDEYPKMVIGSASNQTVRFSKGANPRFASTCASFVDTGGSANWDCEDIINGNSTNDFFEHAELVIDRNGVPNVVARILDSGSTGSVVFAEYVGAGGDCSAFDDSGGSAAWECTTVIDGTFGTDFQRHTSFAIGPNNEKYIWGVNEELGTVYVAKYVGGGAGDCNGIEGSGGSTDWDCTTVVDGTSTRDFQYYGDMAISPKGVPYIVATDENATDSNLMVIYYVGSGGNCDTFDGANGSDEWQCDTIIDGNHIDDFSNQASIAFTNDGRPVIATYEYGKSVGVGGTAGNNLLYVEYVGSGGNCKTFIESTLANTDAWQCTRIIDGNSQLTSDYFSQSSVGVDQNNVPYIVSYNDNVGGLGNNLVVAKYVGGSSGTCATYDDTGSNAGSTAWDCTTVINGNSDLDFERYSSIAFDSSGNPWVLVTEANSASPHNNLIVAKYVGSGGNCATFVDSGGSSAWQCETILNGNDANDFYITGTLAFDRNDVPWLTTVSYNTAGGTAGNNLVVAKLATPSGIFSSSPINLSHVAGNADGNWDYQYHLESGRAPYTDYNGSCEGNSTYGGLCAMHADDGSYDSVVAKNGYGMPYFGMAARFSTNTTVPWVIWTGTSNVSPTSGTITLQIYNYSSLQWETLASTSSSCTGNCKLSGMPVTTTPSNYYPSSGEYWISVRVYQAHNGSTAITFKTDSFTAEQQDSTLHQGGFFRNGDRIPLNRRR